MQRVHTALFSYLLQDFPVFQSEDSDSGEPHLLACVLLVQLSNHKIIERGSCVLASTDPSAGNEITVSDEAVVAVRLEGKIWECLIECQCDCMYWHRYERSRTALKSTNICFAASLPYFGPCIG